MKSKALWLWGIVKAAWWIIAAIVSALLVIGFIRKDKKAQSDIDDMIGEKPQSFVKAAMERASDAITNAKVDVAIVKTQTADKRLALEDIRNEPNGQERRKRLAAEIAKGI